MDVVALVVGVALGAGAVVVMLKARRAARRAAGFGVDAGGSRRSARDARRIDVFAVGEPWRQHVAAAQSAQRRFAGIVTTLPQGPLRARMAEIGRQVDLGVDECWQIAQRGDQLDDTIRQLNGASLQATHDRSTDDAHRASLRSQLDSVQRIRTARDQADQRLRGLQIRLGEIVSQAAEVSAGVDHTAELGSAVDEVVVQLQALNQAVDEVNNTGRSYGFEQNGPGTAASST